MQHLAIDFGNIIEKNRLPQVNVKQGETMMGIISSFQRHYLDPDKTDLNICMHIFGGTAITVVMEAFRMYYLLVEKEALKLQTEPENEEISEQEQSGEEQSRSVKRFSFPPQMDVYKTTCTSRPSTTSKASATTSQGTKHTMVTQKSEDRDIKSKKTQQKRKLRDKLTLSSSSDEGLSKKESKEAE